MGSRTFDIKLRFDKGTTLERMIDGIIAWFKEQINGSFEPGRKDEELIEWFVAVSDAIRDAIKHVQSEHPFTLQRKSFIELGGLDTRSQVTKLLKVIGVMLSRAGIKSAHEILAGRLREVGGFFEEANDNI